MESTKLISRHKLKGKQPTQQCLIRKGGWHYNKLEVLQWECGQGIEGLGSLYDLKLYNFLGNIITS